MHQNKHDRSIACLLFGFCFTAVDKFPIFNMIFEFSHYALFHLVSFIYIMSRTNSLTYALTVWQYKKRFRDRRKQLHLLQNDYEIIYIAEQIWWTTTKATMFRANVCIHMVSRLANETKQFHICECTVTLEVVLYAPQSKPPFFISNIACISTFRFTYACINLTNWACIRVIVCVCVWIKLNWIQLVFGMNILA